MDILSDAGLLFNIALLVTGIIGLYFSVTIFLLARKVKKMPKTDTYIDDLDNDQNSGILTAHGMVRSKDGKGVIADNRPSNTYINSILN